MRCLRVITALGGLAAGVGGCVDGGSGEILSPDAPPLAVVSQSAFGSKIAFARCEVFSNCQIYVMNADGTGQTHVVAGSSPRWSPDGRKLAFTCRPDGNNDVCVVDTDGSNLVQLTNDPAFDCCGDWSPDGRKLVFVSNRNTLPVPPAGCGTTNFEIYAMNADGSGVTRLTDDPGCDQLPSWSPDGRRIAFQSTRDGPREIYVMEANGSDVTRLTFLGVGATFAPDWSPDGRTLAFASLANGPLLNIYTISADGSGLTQLTDAPAFETGPQWSQNGRIAFYSSREGANIVDFSIYIMERDGSSLTRLTDDALSDQNPSVGRGRCQVCR